MMVGPDDAVVANVETVDGADAGGQRDEQLLRGDDRVVQARRELAADGSRRRAAVRALVGSRVSYTRRGPNGARAVGSAPA